LHVDEEPTTSTMDLKESCKAVIDECSSNPQDEIKSKFLVEMPEDFFEFWEFSKSFNAKNPSG
jgi:hypothetical protein